MHDRLRAAAMEVFDDVLRSGLEIIEGTPAEQGAGLEWVSRSWNRRKLFHNTRMQV